MPHKFLKKGQGKLASDYHGKTRFSEIRKNKIIKCNSQEKDDKNNIQQITNYK